MTNIDKRKELLQGYKDQLDHINQTCSVSGQKEYIENQIKILEESMNEYEIDNKKRSITSDGKKRRYYYTVDYVWTEEDKQVLLPKHTSRYVFAKSKEDAKRLFEYRFRRDVCRRPYVILTHIEEDD